MVWLRRGAKLTGYKCVVLYVCLLPSTVVPMLAND